MFVHSQLQSCYSWTLHQTTKLLCKHCQKQKPEMLRWRQRYVMTSLITLSRSSLVQQVMVSSCVCYPVFHSQTVTCCFHSHNFKSVHTHCYHNWKTHSCSTRAPWKTAPCPQCFLLRTSLHHQRSKIRWLKWIHQNWMALLQPYIHYTLCRAMVPTWIIEIKKNQIAIEWSWHLHKRYTICSNFLLS